MTENQDDKPQLVPQRSASDEGITMLSNRLRKNLRSVGKWARQQNISSYRIYDADLPEYAFAIDCYKHRIHMQEYQPPASIPEEKAERRRREAVQAVQDVFELSSDDIVLKTRQRQRGKEQYQALTDHQQKHSRDMLVEEGAGKFLVNLHDYLDTGLFLDHRPIRKFIFENSKDKRFLNLFCYTGSATVHAALGGAASTLSIDLSNTYLDWARRNFQLNGIGGSRHKLKRADCIAYLESPWQEFDLIFLDPPTFSNSKKTENVLDIQRDHVSLIRNAMAKLSAQGLLIFSTNKRGFALSAELSGDFEVRDYSAASLDRDFQRNKKIHQTWLISRQ